MSERLQALEKMRLGRRELGRHHGPGPEAGAPDEQRRSYRNARAPGPHRRGSRGAHNARTAPSRHGAAVHDLPPLEGARQATALLARWLEDRIIARVV